MEILLWHRSIRKEVSDIAETARMIPLYEDFSDISIFKREEKWFSQVKDV